MYPQHKPDKSKAKKKPQPRKPAAKHNAKTASAATAAAVANKADPKTKAKSAPKPKSNKRTVSSARSSSSSDSSTDDDDDDDAAADDNKNAKSKGNTVVGTSDSAADKPKSKTAANKRQKRSPESQTEFKELVVRKRMASLNATAMLAASYEVERHLDMDSLYNGSTTEDSDVDDPPSPKKLVAVVSEAAKAEETDDTAKDVCRFCVQC